MNRKVRVRVGVIIILEKEKGYEVLLVRHLKDGRSYWLLPGGGLKFGETIEECAKRELLEETSLKIEFGDLVFVVESIYPDRTKHVVNLIYRAFLKSNNLKVGGDPRVVEAKFVKVEDLEKYKIFPNIKSQLKEYILKGEVKTRHLYVQWED